MATSLAAPGPVFVPNPVPDPELRLFLMHHAGGSHLVYREWLSGLPPEWEVCLLDAPGRGRLAGRPALTDAGALVEYIRSGIAPLTDRPTAFFGHSMGALVTYELVRALARRGDPLPAWVGLSGWRADAEREPGHDLPTDELRRRVAGLGGTPRELIEDAELWDLFEPVIRSDFRLVDEWSRGGEPWPPGVPVSLFGGAGDALADPRALRDWRRGEFPDARGPHVFEGGHFYFRGRPGEVVARLVADVRSVLGTAAV
ncbi:thioesterase II family protein [Nocardiopsis terrae]